MDSKERQKINAATYAIALVESGMTLGLGTGSTSEYFVKLLCERAKKEQMKLKCVCTSERTKKLAHAGGLKVVEFDDVQTIDLAVDGADEIDGEKMLIKGYGAALTREKIVEYNSDKLVIIADESKVSLSLDKPVPVEYLPFAHESVVRALKGLGAKTIKARSKDSQKLVTDNGMWIVDADFGIIANPSELEHEINMIPGVLENGIFTKEVFKVIIGTDEGAREI
ncbi:MAG: ribose-5-phosphate isomerase RpiA [Candidatus Micrarchaeia archaeon]